MNPLRHLHPGRIALVLLFVVLTVALVIRAGATGAFLMVFIIPILWGSRAPADKFDRS